MMVTMTMTMRIDLVPTLCTRSSSKPTRKTGSPIPPDQVHDHDFDEDVDHDHDHEDHRDLNIDHNNDDDYALIMIIFTADWLKTLFCPISQRAEKLEIP